MSYTNSINPIFQYTQTPIDVTKKKKKKQIQILLSILQQIASIQIFIWKPIHIWKKERSIASGEAIYNVGYSSAHIS
jgi:hypothetical protein